MDKSSNSMPTTLKKRKPVETVEVEKEVFNKMMTQYKDALNLVEELNEIVKSQQETIKRMDSIITTYESMYGGDYMSKICDDPSYEDGVFKASYTPGEGIEIAKPDSHAKLKGAQVELDPFRGKFGINFRFGRD